MKNGILALGLGTLLCFASPAFAEEDEGRPTAPEKPTPTAVAETKATPAPTAKPEKKRTKQKREAWKNQDLELAPAPLMIQKP